MPEDASLDEFLDAGDDREAEPTDRDDDWEDGAAGDEAASADEPVAAETGDGTGGTDTEAGTAAEADDDRDDAGGDDVPAEPAAVEGASATHAWSPDGAACDACGAAVERRWRDDAGLVCAECKEW